MSSPVRISDEEMAEVRRAAQLNQRSISAQVEYWVKLGRAAERSPGMTMSRVEAALRGLQPINEIELTEAEQDDLLMRVGEGPMSAETQAFYQSLLEDDLATGTDENGEWIGVRDWGAP